MKASGPVFHNDTTVAYLARKAEGVAAFRRFAQSYINNPADCAHELLVIFKGYSTNDPEITEARGAFAGVRFREIFVSDNLYDIGAYISAARASISEYILFLNTHTTIEQPSWLKFLHDAVTAPGVGMAGATASYESLYDSVAITSKAVWLASNNVPYNSQIADFYGYVIQQHVPQWLTSAGAPRPFHSYPIDIEYEWTEFWKNKIKPGNVHDFLSGEPRFPNPHIRSNGFIIRRSALLNHFPSIEPTKTAAYHFESGTAGLSALVRNSGLRLVLVNSEGEAFAEADWPKSETFRLGRQHKLLFHDNQTRGFASMSAPAQATHAMLSWGDDACRHPCTLGFSFSVRNDPNRPYPAEGEELALAHIACGFEPWGTRQTRHADTPYEYNWWGRPPFTGQ